MRTRIPITAALTAALLAPLAPSVTDACTVQWALYPTECSLARGSATLVAPAGDYGIFYFGTGVMPICPHVQVGGSETPAVYPPPGPTPEEPICIPGSGCDDTLDKVVQEPWIAIVDWPGWHGLTVDATIRGAAPTHVKTVLLPIHPPTSGCPHVTDVDVLAELAAIAQAVDRGPAAAPLVINMSFGRQHDVNGGTTGTACAQDTLACQIGLLLAHLRRHPDESQPRTVAVAAAGNHREPLFPAALDEVLAVGSLDLTLLAGEDAVEPSWETPDRPEPRALMPGAGFCLEMDFGTGPRPMAVPSGASFAAALFTGWLGEALETDRPAVLAALDKPPRFEPRQDCSGSCVYRLAHGKTLFSTPSGRAGERVRETLTSDLTLCGPPVKGYATAKLIPPGSRPLAEPSLVELVRGQHRPTPEPNPCVPCSLCCESSTSAARTAVPPGIERALGPGGTSGSDDTLAQTATVTPVGVAPAATQPGPVEVDLTIDLHAGWRLDHSSTELVALYLRFSPHLMELELFDPDDLSAIARGEVAYLRILGTLPSPDFDRQPSLIALLRRVDATSPKLFWNATPVVLIP